MKKLLLSITAVVAGYAAYAQVVVAGVSPVSIQGNYEFTTQADCGAWPGETDNGTWGVINNLDFNVPGTFILDTLMLVDDGTPGLNPQGNPIAAEGCDTLINDLTGKIAVIYRNTCSFVEKLQNAQNAGAIAAIIVNREDELLGMLGDAVDGINVTIPAVFISNIDGAALIAEMNNGPVEMFIGNKIGAFNTDLGAVKGEFLIAPYGGSNAQIFDGFDLGIQVYNYGIDDMPNATVNASIDGPNGNVYDETISIPLSSGDTAFIFPGNTDEFPTFNLGGVGNYDNGDYTITYTINTGGAAEDFPFDNVYAVEFKVTDDALSSSRLDGNNLPIATNYPSNNTVLTEYSSCLMVQEPNIDNMIIDGAYIIPHADTALNTMVGTEIFFNAYQWDDAWVDINDAVFQTNNDAFQNLNLLTFGTLVPTTDDIVDQANWVPFSQALTLQNDVRYLFCAQTLEPGLISFGYDNQADNGANYSIYLQPVSPVNTDATWFAAGWNGGPAPAFSLHQTYVGLDEANLLTGNAFPNPANDQVTISVNANGDANLTIVDVAGKVVYNAPVSLVAGQTKVDMSAFESGMYVFSLTTEAGQTAQFNVVKK